MPVCDWVGYGTDGLCDPACLMEKPCLYNKEHGVLGKKKMFRSCSIQHFPRFDFCNSHSQPL